MDGERPEPPVLECLDVSAGHRRADGTARAVLSSVSFRLGSSARLVVIGRSGSGKSTLLRVLNRLAEPLAGGVHFEGRPLTAYDPLALRRRVALVQQTPVVFEGTVRDNLGTRPHGAPEPDDARLEALLADVGLGADFLGRPAAALSVGEKQRLCLARALVSDPRVLLLDEPTSALDPRSLAVIADLVLALAERHTLSVVVSTHQAELARRLSAPVLLIENGTARTDPAPEDVAGFFEGR